MKSHGAYFHTKLDIDEPMGVVCARNASKWHIKWAVSVAKHKRPHSHREHTKVVYK
jgi:hypothetical protein